MNVRAIGSPNPYLHARGTAEWRVAMLEREVYSLEQTMRTQATRPQALPLSRRGAPRKFHRVSNSNYSTIRMVFTLFFANHTACRSINLLREVLGE